MTTFFAQIDQQNGWSNSRQQPDCNKRAIQHKVEYTSTVPKRMIVKFAATTRLQQTCYTAQRCTKRKATILRKHNRSAQRMVEFAARTRLRQMCYTTQGCTAKRKVRKYEFTQKPRPIVKQSPRSL